MLSTVIAAELQFHLETDERDRERAALEAVRHRRLATAAQKAHPSAPVRRMPTAWPRPIVAPAAACC